jgi:hypothetical protein
VSQLRQRDIHRTRTVIRLRGRSSDRGCAATATTTARKGHVQAVYVSIAKVRGRHNCRFLNAKHKLEKLRNCRRPTLFKATGTNKWRFSIRARLPRGHYRIVARGIDASGNKEKPNKPRNQRAVSVR